MHFSSSKNSYLRFVPTGWKVWFAYWCRQAADRLDPLKTLSVDCALTGHIDDRPAWIWDDQSGGFRHVTEDEKRQITSQGVEEE